VEDSRSQADPKRRCPAMVAAGIGDPESQAGKDFCTKQCPYEKCIVFESKGGTSTLRRDERAAKAKELLSEGLYVKDIAARLGVSVRTVERYLES